jgi:predicted  nucleic acid-binding Zn ribbon protein
MHSISISYGTKVDESELWHAISGVIGSLKESGQILGREHHPYIQDGRITCSLWTFSDEALDAQYMTKEVLAAISVLEVLCGSRLETSYDGRGEEEVENICHCTSHAFYVLYYYGDFSPIRCGSCQKFVPLFKIPKLHDNRVWDILGWISSYKACMQLDLNCGTGEKWAIKQMAAHDSGLSKQGRKVAAKLTEVSGVNTYYFLTNVAKRKKEVDIHRPCPSCGGAWHLDEAKFGYFRHQCDTCLLMSSYSNYQI